MTKVLFYTKKDDWKYQFTQDIWSEELGMTNVMFDIQIYNRKHNIQCNKWEYDKENFH